MDDALAPPVVLSPADCLVPGPFQGLRRLSRWLYTQNPFYLLSAWLVFFGLRWSFGPGASLQSSAALFTGLLTYTVLLALASVIVVRFARVWDDARSMLLLVVLLFFGTSIALDETLVQQTSVGRFFYLAAWAVATIGSECVLRAIRLRLPGWYRVGFHSLLAIFYWYPVALTPWLGDPSNPRLQWMLFGFTPCAAICFALLWPAVRRGAVYVRDNGSPWPWPLFPWSLFAILALCVAGRAYYLCQSFHFVGLGDTIFGPYFLLPLLWCLAWLWLSGATRAGRSGIAEVLLLAPIGWAVLAGMHATDPTYRSFLTLFVETLRVSPLFLNLAATLAFYLYARRLRVPGSEFYITLTLAAFSYVGPRSLTFGELSYPMAWPWLVAAAWHAAGAWRERNAMRWLLAGILVAVALDRLLGATPLPWRLAASYHFVLGVVLAVGLFGRDDFSRWLRQIVGPVFLIGSLVCLWHAGAPFPQRPLAAQAGYGLALATVALAYARLVRLRVYVLAAVSIIATGSAASVWPWYARSRLGSPGLDYIIIGLACLALGLAVSFAKAGYWSTVNRRLQPPATKPSASGEAG